MKRLNATIGARVVLWEPSGLSLIHISEPLRLPLSGVALDGTIDLGHDGLAMVCRASAVTFSLRTPSEQEALVSGFARWLNWLAESVQIVVRAESFDLTPSIDALLDAGAGDGCHWRRYGA